ncbi:MAG: exodeoxyribonuclease VII small subunit, partial [Stenotrophomonas sp.]|nr:exodeoxyribonuclease VII small subunit [Stenotrophomonas sp.]
MAKKTPENASPVAQFEQSLESLEQLVEQMETGELSLEASLSAYERGVGLLKHCYGQLKTAEQKIVQLTGVNADGAPVLDAFEHTAA